jgi:hypothetical protein
MRAESHEYIHHELNREVTAIGGHYVLTKEVRLPFAGREALYLVGYAVVDNSCCGVGGMAYAHVPGFIVAWKSRASDDGLAVSLVEPIDDPTARAEIRRLIQGKEIVHQIRFE